MNKENYKALKIIIKEFDNDLGGRNKEFENALEQLKNWIEKRDKLTNMKLK